jgi:hypothetical protein
MSVLRVQQLMNEAGNGPVELTNGATFGPESATLTEEQLTISTTGIATVTTLIANNINVVGIMTGTFVGNGVNITNPPGTPIGKVIGQHLIT